MEPEHGLSVEACAHKIVGINKNMTSKREERKKVALDKQIDENLKRVYAAALNEELPDRFRDLLAQLKAKEGPGSGGQQ